MQLVPSFTPHPIFDILHPVAFSVGPLAVHWYGIAYALGVLLGYWLIVKMDQKDQLLPEAVKQGLIPWSMVGIIVGGRLGYVFIYQWQKFLANPLYLFKTWGGGMSFHGGMLGLAIALILLARKNKISPWVLGDRVVLVAPIGIFFGRLANFVNAEVVGRVTNHAFGIIFPEAGPFYRHPSQLYEAMGEGVVLGIVLFILFLYGRARFAPGTMVALFLMGYGSIRIILENFREPDVDIGFLWHHLTMGQCLSIPMVLVGMMLAVWQYRKGTRSA